MDKLKKVLSREEDEEQGVMSQISEATSLSYETRIKGFIICFVLGVVLGMLATFLLFTGNLALFAILYTIGTILSLASTLFLMGPLNQMKRMFAETRIIATIVMLACIVMTLVSALALKITPLAIVFAFLQFLALLWYSISYIPFARDAVKKCFESCMS